MARRRTRARQAIRRYAGVARGRARGRRGYKNNTMRMLKKGAIGTVAGTVVSTGLTMVGKYTNIPQLAEVGQRAGAVVASALGGTPGEVGFQVADAVMDRVIQVPGYGLVSGTQGATAYI